MICDRIAVMYEGRFMGIVDPSACDFEQVGMMMAGAHSAGLEEACDEG